ncbi:MAG: hypothetical protein HPY57_13995 [Ignavibacteria bacterium]|nr:hypothetical protein [Ignavibacteria bacterium]
MVTISYDEYEKYLTTIDQLRTQIQNYQTEIIKLKQEIAFLKDSGENILVIIKDKDKPDVHEYKTTEKNILTDLVAENYRVRERYDELSRKIDNVENQKQLIILKYKEMESIYKAQISKLEEYIKYLEERGFLDRIKNKKKNIQEINIVSFDEPIMLESGPQKTIYSENEIKRLEEEAKKVKKPRGWHFYEEFVDSEGNVYHKGKLQPHLKGTK